MALFDGMLLAIRVEREKNIISILGCASFTFRRKVCKNDVFEWRGIGVAFPTICSHDDHKRLMDDWTYDGLFTITRVITIIFWMKFCGCHSSPMLNFQWCTNAQKQLRSVKLGESKYIVLSISKTNQWNGYHWFDWSRLSQTSQRVHTWQQQRDLHYYREDSY